MIKVENIETMGWKGALRGMRNPLNSWEKSDTRFWGEPVGELMTDPEMMIIGPNDLSLMQRLYKGGTEHRKYLRQIFVSMDITAPLYWWKEIDQYKVGTTTNSCSTMHKIQAKEFTLEDFSVEHLTTDSLFRFSQLLDIMNSYRDEFNKTKNKDAWWQMIQMLPTSYNQKRTITMNYENVFSMIRQRTGHKLDEWNIFVQFLKDLPYVVAIDPSLAMHESGGN